VGSTPRPQGRMLGSMRRDQRRLPEVTFVAFDTETTGLQPIVHRLVEVGAVRFRLDGCELATFQQLIDPHIPIPRDVQQVHGITDRMGPGRAHRGTGHPPLRGLPRGA
jgi:DNA polymerase III subunit epsilon